MGGNPSAHCYFLALDAIMSASAAVIMAWVSSNSRMRLAIAVSLIVALFVLQSFKSVRVSTFKQHFCSSQANLDDITADLPSIHFSKILNTVIWTIQILRIIISSLMMTSGFGAFALMY
jgi:mannose/fructose/N-acetylgalactosamine-specific phosphotransferase system component IIC